MAWPTSFWPAALIAVAFWMSISLGCLGIGLLHPLTEGLWGWGVSRELNAGMGTIPLTGLFVLPFVFSARSVFPWAQSLEALNPHQQTYLAPSFVLLRTVIEWGLWCGLAAWLLKGYRQSARDPAFRLSTKFSAIGLILFWFSVTSASIDGLMSLDPTNNSSMFGAIEIMGCAVAGLAWILLMRCRRDALNNVEERISHDLGNLLFAFNFIWVYLAFSQYLIVWAADLPHETRWHIVRQRGTAGLVGLVILATHFVVPFGLLLSADLKRRPNRLAAVAGMLLAARLADFCWTVIPACPGVDWRISIGLVASVVLLGTLWIAQYRYREARLPILDPLQMAAITKETVAAPVEVMS